MPSIMSLVIHSNTTGRTDASNRDASPNTTTVGPEHHTILRTAGTLRSAERRSRHPVQKLCAAILGFYRSRKLFRAPDRLGHEECRTWIVDARFTQVTATKDAETQSKVFVTLSRSMRKQKDGLRSIRSQITSNEAPPAAVAQSSPSKRFSVRWRRRGWPDRCVQPGTANGTQRADQAPRSGRWRTLRRERSVPPHLRARPQQKRCFAYGHN